MLEIQGLHVTVNGKEVLKGIDLVINKIERVLMGPNEGRDQAMRIRLKCSGFDAVWAFGQDEVESKAEPATLQALLQELAHKSREKGVFFNPQSDTFHEEYEILVNGCALYTLPRGLSTELNDGDEVQIMVALGGG